MRKQAGAALLMGASSVAGVLLSFAIQAYLAYRFGAGAEMDAYVAAMTLPAFLAAVFIPSISIVLIPVFVDSIRNRGADAAWRTASNVVNIAVLALGAAIAIAAASAPILMRWIVPGFDPATLSLAVSLVRWLLPATGINIVASTLIGLYQAEERFGPTALAPLISSAVLLGTAVVLAPSLGIHGIAVATVVGNLAQLAFLLPVFRSHYHAVLDLRDEGLRVIAALLTPLLAGGLVYRATVVADRLVASWLPRGSLSHLEYAGKIAAVLNVVFASGIAAALYPLMSSQAAAGDLPRLRETFLWGQRLLTLVLFPALAIGWVLRVPLLQIAFQRGQFAAADTLAVAALVSWFMLAVVGGVLGNLVGRVYYVMKDTRTPVLLGLMETGAYCIYLPLLARAFGAAGVAMANAIYFLGALVVNGAIILRRLQSDRTAELFTTAARIALFAAIAGATSWAVAQTLRGPVLVLLAGSAAGLAAYVGLMALVRAPEVRDLRALLSSRPE